MELLVNHSLVHFAGKTGCCLLAEASLMTRANAILKESKTEAAEEERGLHIQGKFRRTYPACLAEPALKEWVERHRVFSTTGQAAVCNKDRVRYYSNYRPSAGC